MIKHAIKAFAMSALVILAPAAGNNSMFFQWQIWFIYSVCVLSSILQPNYKIRSSTKDSIDRGTEIQIIYSVVISQLLSVAEASYIRFPNGLATDTLSIVFIATILMGLALRTWSVYTLGRFFTMEIGIQKDHRIIQTGPYAVFRHPSYVGAFLVYTSTIALLQSWHALIIGLFIMSWAWQRRMQCEEQMMISEFGDEYRSYCQRVKRIRPRLFQ